MDLINSKELYNFLKKHKTAASLLNVWRAIVEEKQWSSYQELLNDWPKLHRIDGTDDRCRVVFKIRNDWRIDTYINFKTKTLVLKRIGSHEEYNKWTYE